MAVPTPKEIEKISKEFAKDAAEAEKMIEKLKLADKACDELKAAAKDAKKELADEEG